MTESSYSIDISASPETVWQAMITRETYAQWTQPFGENSRFEGKWEQGETIRYFDGEHGGTKAIFEVLEPGRLIVQRHVAMLHADGGENPDHEFAPKWDGTMETYRLEPTAVGCKLTVEMRADEAFMPMFDASWPQALEILKRIAEA